MSDTTKTPRPHAENERLRDLIMRRPALNTGILHAYAKWNAECYAATAIPAPEVNADHIDVEAESEARTRDLDCPYCGGSGHVGDATSSAAMDVLAERCRQIEVKGWTPEHDDSHNHGELAHAAGVLALADIKLFLRCAIEYWPWDAPSMEADIIGTSCRTRLIKAAALLLAEIERLDRATTKKSEARHD